MNEKEKYKHFDDRMFPFPDPDLEWTFRYGTPTREQILRAADILSAYQFLVHTATQTDRNYVVKQLRTTIE